MTDLSAESRVKRILRVFHRSGREGQWIRSFDAFSADVREQLLGMVSLKEGELPILAYFRSPEQWVLLTTERLILREPNRTLSLHWSEVENATVDAAYAGAALASGAQGKHALSRLMVLYRDGESTEIELEAGPPFLGFWNVLKTVANLGKA